MVWPRRRAWTPCRFHALHQPSLQVCSALLMRKYFDENQYGRWQNRLWLRLPMPVGSVTCASLRSYLQANRLCQVQMIIFNVMRWSRDTFEQFLRFTCLFLCLLLWSVFLFIFFAFPFLFSVASIKISASITSPLF